MKTNTVKILRLELGLYSITEVARLLGIDHEHIRRATADGVVPAPTHTMPNAGTRQYFDKADVKVIRAFFRERTKRTPTDLMTIKTMAKVLHVRYPCFRHWVMSGYIPAPTHRWKVRKYYKTGDIAKMQAAVKRMKEERQANVFQRLAERGYLTAGRVADILKMPRATVMSWIYKGWFPRPTRTVEGLNTRPLYCDADIAELRRIKTERQKK
jgi:DNA-binding transcriptional MerR regulator